jgi:uncharacterized membrane protein YphA (DoxX/SURF4 family)
MTIVFRGGIYLADAGNQTLGTWSAGLLAVASGALLLIGFVTPLASFLILLSGIVIALFRFALPGHSPVESIPSTVYIIIMAAAIVLLGPGAFSLDARLFGRREIIIPPSLNSGRQKN